MDNILNSNEMRVLSQTVEEAARSTKEGVKHFVEPAEGTLNRATSKRHHIVFGRRGSGKSSLLLKAAADLTVDRRPIAYVNLEAFKGHSYPDVLLSVLINTFQGFEEWLSSAAIHPARRKSFWLPLFGTTPARPSFCKKDSARLAEDLRTEITTLEEQLHAPDDSKQRIVRSEARAGGRSTKASVQAGVQSASLSAGVDAIQQTSHSEQSEEEFRKNKIDFLHRHVLDYQKVFQTMAKLSSGDSFLFLDDLYHIKRSDQARVIDYFHRIAKDNHLWLKIGTIRHRSDWYIPGDPPVGLKLADDADAIDLDITLEKYSLAKQFLLKILRNFSEQHGLSIDDFLTTGAKDRLVLASGGVARDFLSIFRRSIAFSRERGGGPRGEQISAEDVNMAAGEYDSSKREEFKRDTSGDDKPLDDEFQKVRDFCLEKCNSNCFLLAQDARGPRVHLIHELVDLKLLHLVRSRVTVSGRPGKVYEAYMLDLSQYAGARKRRGLKTIEFWKPHATESLRKISLIYDASH